jgi:hypothetical protein
VGQQHLASDLATGADREVRRFYHSETGACFGHGPLDASQAPADQSQVRKASEEDELARSFMEEMGGSEIAAQFLVDHDTARERVWRRCNHENDGAPVAKDCVCHVKGLFERSQQGARDSGLVEELEIVVLFGSSAVAVGQKKLQLSLSCRRLGPTRDVDEERVPNVDKDQADSICPSCGQRAGGAVADEAQLGNRRFDLETRTFAN